MRGGRLFFLFNFLFLTFVLFHSLALRDEVDYEN